ncbi:hypothetical protein [Clostridium cadaveris]|uniref:hypothetical protein n=1 Tax=Clostridium cadaveris TaxID=1529 RepID=UPI0015B465AC|nr:hypothetical protein [Clostridium cadaveris]NWK11303.1 hypothetical protein [Clostridium cadaveris]
MEFVTLEQLEAIELDEEVEKVEFNGISGQDGSSRWYTVYYKSGEEKDIYVDSSEEE